MNDHDVADPVNHSLARLQKESGLALADVLETILRLALFVHGVLDNAVLVAGKNYDFVFINQIFMSV